MQVNVIGISGGSGSGKTTLAEYFVDKFKSQGSVLLGQDHYYIDQSKNFDKDGGAVNFDHPSSIEASLLAKHIEALSKGEPVEVPIYDFATHAPKKETTCIHPAKWVVVEGTMIFHWPELRQKLTHKIFITVPEQTRFERRLRRDTTERGRTPEGVRAQFYTQVKPMHDEFVETSAQFADKIVDNDVPLSNLFEEAKKVFVK